MNMQLNVENIEKIVADRLLQDLRVHSNSIFARNVAEKVARHFSEDPAEDFKARTVSLFEEHSVVFLQEIKKTALRPIFKYKRRRDLTLEEVLNAVLEDALYDVRDNIRRRLDNRIGAVVREMVQKKFGTLLRERVKGLFSQAPEEAEEERGPVKIIATPK
jgi:hypothetical protein